MLTKFMKFSRSVITALVIGSFCTIITVADTGESFLPGTTINDVAVGGMTAAQASEKLVQYYQQDYQLDIIASDQKKEQIKGSDIGYQVIISDLSPLIEQRKSSGDSKLNLEIGYQFNEEALKDKLQGLECFSGSQVVPTTNARISDYQAGQQFTIIPEAQGNSVNLNRTIDGARHELLTGNAAVFLEPLGCYDQITVRADDAVLKEMCTKMNSYTDVTITYLFGDATELLDGGTIASWLIINQDNAIDTNKEKVTQYIATLAQKYDTANTTRTFQSASGRQVQVAGSYGWQINQAAELQALCTMIQNGTVQERTPEYIKSAVSRTLPDWGNTFVEIDLTGQHVYLYQNGEITWDAPCVTGNVAKGYTTPAGIFTLDYKQTDRVLRGKIMPNGKYEYESPVDYWMPFNGGIGLHDANWRSKFGGEIYKNSGSHGCINLPPKLVPQLYAAVYAGIPVICYN